jgi:aminoglycoside phosphotransferase (APT) family kinase protein
VADRVLLGSGRTADVYAINATRVLRRYRDGTSALAEADVMRYAATVEYPVPAVYAVDGPDLIMERLVGPTMRQALAASALEIPAGAAMLADLHRRLHAAPAPSGSADLRLLHLDLHPDNVMLTPRGPVVIDWCNATEGPADLDIALTAVILAQVAVDDTFDLAAAARSFLGDFLRLVDGDAVRLVDRATALRAANPTMSAAELTHLGAAGALVRSLAPSSPG